MKTFQDPARLLPPETPGLPNRPAGFWARLTAAIIDIALLGLLAWLLTSLLATFGRYLPLELTTLLLLTLYSVLMLARHGTTFGKTLCGITVRARDGSPIRWPRALLREALGKPLSAPAFLGFITIATTPHKRAWHDSIARTNVLQSHTAIRRTRWIFLAECLLLLASFTPKLPPILDALRPFAPHNNTPPFPQQQSILHEVTSLGPNLEPYLQWINSHAQSPADFVLRIASAHQLTLLGEYHGAREGVAFLNQILPDLYHRAGVTCLALEVCSAQDNHLLHRLVTADTFDQALWLRIARRACWPCWGDQEYWDLLKTVWEINHRLPPAKPKMRVIGLSFHWDAPSFALALHGPICERLRLLRLLPDLPILFFGADRLYARNLEKQTIAKNQKAVIWVGSAHTPLHGPGPDRMGGLLFRKYGQRVSQIRLHEKDKARTRIGAFIEQLMAGRNHAPVAFNVTSSPFALLRDTRSGDPYSMTPYRQTNASFAHFAANYLYLAPAHLQTRCTWLDNYITPQMFGKHKPFYELASGQKLHTADSANRFALQKPFNF